jgi:hypothetical protein
MLPEETPNREINASCDQLAQMLIGGSSTFSQLTNSYSGSSGAERVTAEVVGSAMAVDMGHLNEENIRNWVLILIYSAEGSVSRIVRVAQTSLAARRTGQPLI